VVALILVKVLGNSQTDGQCNGPPKKSKRYDRSTQHYTEK